MKPNPWLLPAAALLVSGGWIFHQKKSAATLEREIAVLTESVRAARVVHDVSSPPAGKAAANDAKSGKIDWKKIGATIAKMQGGGGMGQIRSFIRLKKQLMEMSADQLIAQLEEIDALDLATSEREALQAMVLGTLAEKDPQLALDHAAKVAGDEDSGMHWQLSAALGKWAEKDTAAATAWLDRQIAAGTFNSKSLDGKNQALLRFESALLPHLLDKDPAAAASRVAALPGDQREDLFRNNHFMQMPEGRQQAYADLVRGSLPQDKAADALARAASRLANKDGYSKVDDFIRRTSATSKETEAIAGQVVENSLFPNFGTKPDFETLAKARAWAAEHSPSTVDDATGKSLGNALYRGTDFDQVSQTVLQYNAESGNDAVLAAFLKSGGARQRSRDKAAALIDQITDPAVREEILKLPEYRQQKSSSEQ